MSNTQPVRCLQLCKFYYPVLGGIESVVFELTEGLVRRGFELEVLCANDSHRTVTDHQPYAVTRAASLGKILSTSMSPAMIVQGLRRMKTQDIIHVHLPDPMANLALFIARPRAKLVVHWHSDIVNQQGALRIYAPLQNWLLRRADAVVATSLAYARSSSWLQPFTHKVHVVPIGIREPRVDEVAAAELRKSHSGKRIIFALGRMVYYKGFDILIDAAALLPDDCVVLIGGSGELLETYRAEVRARGLEGRVAFLGRLTDDEVQACMQACEVFCLPSVVRSEAFGVVLLEAMAASRPIVATCIEGSGVPWVNQHGETGYNVPVADAAALASALTSLLADTPTREAFGRAGRRRFEQFFTADRMVDATTALYQKLLAA